jgi:acyl carrier protein
LFALEKILQEQTLDFCLLASSLSTVLGGIGYAAFAAADSFLDAFSQDRNRPGHAPWISVNWDSWQLDGEDGQGTAVSNNLAQLALTTSEVGQVFQRVLAVSTMGQVVISTSDLIARMNRELSVAASRSRSQDGNVLSRHARPQLSNPYVAPQNELEATITNIWQRMLGIEPIGIDDNFFDLGGNSLIAVSTMAELKKELQTSISIARLYQKPNIRNLSELLTQDEILTQQRVTVLSERREKLSRRNQILHKRNQA